jgi:hypothetical protein
VCGPKIGCILKVGISRITPQDGVKLQERYGWTRERAESEAEEFFNRQSA